MSNIETAPGRPSRPADSHRVVAICEAALELLQEVGYDRLTVDAVAARAHASKATLYRHWPQGKAQLVVTALKSRSTPPMVCTDTGSLRSDLLSLLGTVAASLTREDLGLMAGLLLAMRSDEELAAAVRTQVLERQGRPGRAADRTGRGSRRVRPAQCGGVAARAASGPAFHPSVTARCADRPPLPRACRRRRTASRPDPTRRWARIARRSCEYRISGRRTRCGRLPGGCGRHPGCTDQGQRCERQCPLAGPGGHRHRPADGRARRLHREHRAAVGPARPAHLRRQPAVGGHRLHPRLRRPAAAGRSHRRLRRPQADVHHRPARLRRRLRARRHRPERRHAVRGPRPAGRLRRAAGAGRAVAASP